MKTFTPGQQLSARSISNSDCKFTAEVLKRTAKTVTILTDDEGEKRCKIHNNNDQEYIFPYGRYSMCPVFRA